MRISAQLDDVAYRADAALFNVLLNGARLSLCHTADEELGEAWVYVLHDDGRVAIDSASGKLKTLCRRGKVVIEGPVNGAKHG